MDFLKDKYESYIYPEPNTGCWIWAGDHSNLYGRFTFNGKRQLAHRISYQLHKGEIPSNMFVCHRCDSPFCVNPDHLFVGTAKDNVHDMMKKGRRRGSNKLSEEQVKMIRSIDYSRFTMLYAAKKFGVTEANVSYILSNKSWK